MRTFNSYQNLVCVQVLAILTPVLFSKVRTADASVDVYLIFYIFNLCKYIATFVYYKKNIFSLLL